MLAAANCITIEGFLQHNRRRSKKLRSRGGFEAVSALTHMNRQKIETPGKQNRNQTLNNKKQCKPKNQ
jgi:hypothetical protein